jgi:peroxiredoxin
MKTAKRMLVLTLALVFAFGMLAEAGSDGKVKMDKKARDFKLKDAMGKTHSLAELSKEKKAAVVMFIATQCPVSNAYNERMAELHDSYKDKEIQFIGVNSNRQEPAKEIAEHSKENGFEFVVLKDLNNKIADYFGARRTPEVYLLDENLTLRYHGAIDNDQYNPKTATPYLKEVLDLVVAGKEIPKDMRETKAFGCTIKRIKTERTRKSTP